MVIDIVVAVVLLAFGYFGWAAGSMQQLVLLGVAFAAVLLGKLVAIEVAVPFQRLGGASAEMAMVVCYVVIFAALYVGLWLLARRLSADLRDTDAGRRTPVDKALGATFAMGRALLFVLVAMWVLLTYGADTGRPMAGLRASRIGTFASSRNLIASGAARVAERSERKKRIDVYDVRE